MRSSSSSSSSVPTSRYSNLPDSPPTVKHMTRRHHADRGARRLRRVAPNVRGYGGHFGAPILVPSKTRETAAPGRAEREGVWGPFRGPHPSKTRETAAPGRAEREGYGGHFGAPILVIRRAARP